MVSDPKLYVLNEMKKKKKKHTKISCKIGTLNGPRAVWGRAAN